MDMDNIKDKLIKSGKKILRDNEFIGDLNDIMQDNKFRYFYDKYFNDITDVKTVIMYMKLYETIQKEYIMKNGVEIETELLAYIIKELMSNTDNIKQITNSFQNYIDINNSNTNNNTNNKLLDLFNVIPNNKLLN